MTEAVARDVMREAARYGPLLSASLDTGRVIRGRVGYRVRLQYAGRVIIMKAREDWPSVKQAWGLR